MTPGGKPLLVYIHILQIGSPPSIAGYSLAGRNLATSFDRQLEIAACRPTCTGARALHALVPCPRRALPAGRAPPPPAPRPKLTRHGRRTHSASWPSGRSACHRRRPAARASWSAQALEQARPSGRTSTALRSIGGGGGGVSSILSRVRAVARRWRARRGPCACFSACGAGTGHRIAWDEGTGHPEHRALTRRKDLRDVGSIA
eukprot:360779-Chlamydomonas_euryale.AAC.6